MKTRPVQIWQEVTVLKGYGMILETESDGLL